MAQTVSIDRPPVARAAVSRPRSGKIATVNVLALALHLDCSRTYISKLEAEGVIHGKVTASRSIRAALPTSDTCGARAGSRCRARLPPI